MHVASVRRRTDRVRLLNAEVDDITMDELLETFTEGMLLTLHVDMLMKLQKDKEFFDILPRFDVITCDSHILYLASKFLGRPVRERVSGSDFFPRYYMCHKDNSAVTIFLCGGSPGVAEIARERINEKVGREMIVGTFAPHYGFDEDPDEISRIISAVNESRATALLVGLGGGRQEKFIVKFRDRFEYVRTFLPLGGTIDYEAETLRRPPAWITNVGLEWFYRLLKEPRLRWRRYLLHQPPIIYLLLMQKLGLYKNPFESS